MKQTFNLDRAIELARTQKGIESRAEVARRAGIKPVSLTAAIYQGGSPSAERICQLAEALEMSAIEFFKLGLEPE